MNVSGTGVPYPPFAIQMLRANRPTRAERGARRAEYTAGLKQAQQLWSASSAIGPDSRPILLFYGLAQAARALCVARLDGDDWKDRGGHGLKVTIDPPADGAELDLSRVTVEYTGNSLVTRTARALGSPVLAKPATLSELIASLDTKLYFDQTAVKGLKPVIIASDWRGADGPLAGVHMQRLIIGRVPDEFGENREVVPASSNNMEYQRIVDPDLDEFSSWLANYPTLKSLGRPTRVSVGPSLITIREDPGTYQAHVEWGNGAHEAGDNQLEWTERFIDAADRAESPWDQSVAGVTFPGVGGNSSALHPLVNWWLILYPLSVLARYYPRVWSGLLDVDQSRFAVPMQHLLDEAASNTQRLIAEELLCTSDD